MNIRRIGVVVAGLVLIATVLVAAGVGQGAPPKAMAITAAAQQREVQAVAHGSASVRRGEQLFSAHGCSDCHTMAAGGYAGRLGPRLDVQSQGDAVKAVLHNIENPPDDDPGYEAGLMPENFGSRLSADDLRDLAAYVHAAATAAKGSSGGS